MVQERRARQRVSVHFDVDIMLDKEVIQVQILNISLTGILCTSHPFFQKNAPCRVRISLSDDQQITIDSKILRVGEQGTAICFLEMDEQSFVHLMWCSTLTVTQAASKEINGIRPPTENAAGRFPSESDKSVMLETFGIPPEKCR
ncbi:MAG: PilZ domain-containing protein [Proteobacteria bacterium]|nr:PilZ domain-containing protein [Pseudomonadota bacterium]